MPTTWAPNCDDGANAGVNVDLATRERPCFERGPACAACCNGDRIRAEARQNGREGGAADGGTSGDPTRRLGPAGWGGAPFDHMVQTESVRT